MKLNILIPTYNEAENIVSLLNQISKIEIPNIEIKVLVIDDGSPDKTADLVQDQNYPNVRILRRKSKSGLGPSYLAGIQETLRDSSFTHIVSMDADGSHRIVDLLNLIDNAILNPNKLIIGTRWISGGAVTNWPKYREWISRAGTWYARRALRLDIKDITGGFKIYPVEILKRLDLTKLKSNGYCYQIEISYACIEVGASYLEIPINFVERSAGKSKMSGRIVLEAMAQISLWGLALRGIGNADK